MKSNLNGEGRRGQRDRQQGPLADKKREREREEEGPLAGGHLTTR